jgi:hypothetical protein
MPPKVAKASSVVIGAGDGIIPLNFANGNTALMTSFVTVAHKVLLKTR